ncbi:MAG: corrinoid protein [Bryobacterales bacterium]|nr:corrinoid protein [Bryobacterales bacterium]
MADLQNLYEAVLNGNTKLAVDTTRQALEEGADPVVLVTQYMIPAMDEVGRRYECEDYFVPELLLSARAMKGSLELIRPLLVASGAQPRGRVVVGTVKGDLHDIGKNLVAAMLEGSGFEVIDLGADVSPERFIEAAKQHNADIVCLSALLTVTMPSMKKTVDAFQAAGLRDSVKIMVGGAPVTARFAAEIGADGYGENARVAVEMARMLVPEKAATGMVQ